MSQQGRSPGTFMPLGQAYNHNQSQNHSQNHNSYPSQSNNYFAASAAAAVADLPPPPQRPGMRRVESSSSEDSISLQIAKARSPTQQHYPQFPSQQSSSSSVFSHHPNSSTNSLQNFSRPTPSPLSSAAAVAARSVVGNHDAQQRNPSPLSLRSAGHSRKHSQTPGVFEPTLPSISTSNLSTHVSMSQQSPRELSASHIAAQAAVLSHQQSQQMLQQHSRQRSQTGPMGTETPENLQPPKRASGPLNPPALSLTEASAPRDTVFGGQSYHNGLLGSNAAATAANAAFPRSGQTSPVSQIPPQPLPPPSLPDKKPEKSSKVKLFSRPGKIGVKGETKDRPLPSPSKFGSALSVLQKGNFSTTSLADASTPSFYNMNNASSATIRPMDVEREGKEKKHHFLSRQRHKTKDKDDYHSQLSSAASNSRPTDPNAPTSLYNFNLPSSPGPNSSTFKNISGLGHGGRGRKKDDKETFNESVGSVNEWNGPGSLGSLNTPLYLEPIDSAKYGLNSMSLEDAFPYLKSKLLVIFEGDDLRLPVEDFNRIVTLHIQYCIQRRSPNQVLDDLRDLLWTGFRSLDHNLRKHAEDRLVPNLVDLWIHVFTGVLPYMQAVFLPLDLEFNGCGTLMTTEQAREFWGGVVTNPKSFEASSAAVNVAPAAAVLEVRRIVLTAYRDVVILPRYEKLKTIFSRLSLEFLPMTIASPLPVDYLSASPGAESMTSFSFSQQQRPGTAMSLDPSTASFNSTSTTLLGDLAGGRSRGLSNVSFASSGAHSGAGTDPLRPPKLTSANSSSMLSFGASVSSAASFAGSGLGGVSGSGGGGGGGYNHSMSANSNLVREQNIEDSKYVTDMVGRMLQCMSVLAGATGNGPRAIGNASVGLGLTMAATAASAASAGAGGIAGGDEGAEMVEELSRLLKLNWLGRGRTGRNRRGIVGGRVARRSEGMREEVEAT
ncbi:HbrB-like-domain-containing protein [Coniella lustricola]|uniref:HbrB-like-domain-containing protein n=1 Tax=Coniella lustricola TaxID=2025994 RepID=A0A2T3A8C1_9PEZI|nr:HbrB-like-domain-containing protein [Coniella lustricola]